MTMVVNMHRFALDHLVDWKDRPGRRPLVIRGARQVGKSHLVRMLAKEHFESLVELDFERNPELASLFESKDPRRIIQLLELQRNVSIRPGQTLVFLDEIQAAPSVFAALRYFFEELPALHVIAAGSLLELALGEPSFSVPVGRLEYLHLGPMQFEEVLLALGEKRASDFLAAWTPEEPIPDPLHGKLMEHFRSFLVLGGMPGALSAYVEHHSLLAAEEVKHSILATFKDDFGKYGRTIKHQRLATLYGRIPALVGSRFKYVNVDRAARAADLSQALDLLCGARVAHRVRHTSAGGIPLGAQAKDRIFKVLFLDVGLMNTALGLSLVDIAQHRDALLVHSGAVCEQAVGQHLLCSLPFYQEPELYFWAREKGSSQAEVDYVLAEGEAIFPVEVKAGKTGALKSLHVFLREKRRSFGIRINSDAPSLLQAETALPDGKNIPFTLLSLPLYLVGQTRRLARAMVRSS